MPNSVAGPVKVRAAVISLVAGVAILVLKMAAYLATGSVALLSDAAESIINVIAANIALASLMVASQPPDEHDQYGHAKAEYVSSATEAAMIGIAGVVIVAAAVNRLVHPQALERLPLGLTLMTLASCVNLLVGWRLLRISRDEHSIALEASAKHLMSDVITSAGVFVGVVLVMLTGWTPLDAIAAIMVGANITWIGAGLYRRSISGLLDVRLPPEEEAEIREILDAHQAEIVEFHAMRTRQAGPDRFIDLHLVLHRSMTLGEAHALTDHLEQHLQEVLPRIDVTIHTEPCAPSCPRCATAPQAPRS